MKKILLVAVVGLLFASSCSGEKKPKTKNANAPKAVAAEGIKHITKAEYLTLVWNYEKNPSTFVFEGKLPVIVDFYATWCGPCKRVAPILEKLSKKYAGKINIYKVDVDAERDLAASHGIQSIPTMYFYPKTGQPQVVQGALGEEQLEQAIQQVLLSK
ncbi:thioredoxin [Acetobacteroides hydrogenigenes]|uniref:Thioredoxin n=1 Tax=Acetobacteroides hydrogenigenes TaxID=979970 RepID=A0A4R2EWI6_9BACT|nr:thioredoxin [Acetobacteroides hydrogenigenes]TCN73056.1 thioredoxin [Acetobacteroides hydrogenigenes]